MADDPNKKKADSKRVSRQKHEQAYQRTKSKRSGSMPGGSNSRSKPGSRGGSTNERGQ